MLNGRYKAFSDTRGWSDFARSEFDSPREIAAEYDRAESGRIARGPILASEYSTGKKHGGRIDTLGIDENGYPVIIEYKRTLNENVINQGLFYLDWLLDHKAELQLLVLERLGEDVANTIDWSSPRLLCIAGGFTKYDLHAVEQINRAIELIRYAKYGEELLLLELVNFTSTAPSRISVESKDRGSAPCVQQLLAEMTPDIRDLYEALKAFLCALGEDVGDKETKLYVAFRRLKNFAYVRPSGDRLSVWVKVDPEMVSLKE